MNRSLSGIQKAMGKSPSGASSHRGSRPRKSSAFRKPLESSSKADNVLKPDLRCIKFSPSVKQPKFVTTLEIHDFEAKAWRNCFDAMGSLNALGTADVRISKTSSEEPYHCNSLGRKFQGNERPAATSALTHPMSQEKGPKHFARREQIIIPRIHTVHLPKIWKNTSGFALPKHLLTGDNPAPKPYFPPSAVTVNWSDAVTDNSDVLFEWLDKIFGEILFTVFRGPRRGIVVFDNINSSYDLNYKLTSDPIWKKGVAAMREDGMDTYELFGF